LNGLLQWSQAFGEETMDVLYPVGNWVKSNVPMVQSRPKVAHPP